MQTEEGGIVALEVGTGRDVWDSPEEGLSLQTKRVAVGSGYSKLSTLPPSNPT